MKTLHRADPSWWSEEHESAWERVKAAFRRDWQQTKHDFGGDAPNLNQDVPDTVGQAAGTRPIPPENVSNFEDNEPAYRFGYAAHRYHRTGFPEWNTELEQRLQADWGTDYDRYRTAIRQGWDYPA